jgi:hypothetical protein
MRATDSPTDQEGAARRTGVFEILQRRAAAMTEVSGLHSNGQNRG